MLQVRNFKEIPYEQLEELNSEAKAETVSRADPEKLREKYMRYLHDEKQLKAVTVCFSDLEGRFHMLDYDKKYLLSGEDCLGFDGSSIRGFSRQRESDLRLRIDWGSFRWLPSDIFGPGKVMVFAFVRDAQNREFEEDMRQRLKNLGDAMHASGLRANMAFEVEGFLFKGTDAEQNFIPARGFEFVSDGGYFHTLPNTPLKLFIDHFAEAQRALGFENEKDHPEVAPSQFELNYACTEALVACDQVQIYKLLARQIASMMGYTASFLPKPVANVNGSGMHVNLSVARDGVNLFYDKDGEGLLSSDGWKAVRRLLRSASESCLIMNSSVNAYRRLDPRYEAPNEIRVSRHDRGAMIRIPGGSPKSARIELRSVAPDANPYMTAYAILMTIADESLNADEFVPESLLPSTIDEALHAFEQSDLMKRLLGERAHQKYAALKTEVASRSPKALGTRLKRSEIVFHHEVTNQSLWQDF